MGRTSGRAESGENCGLPDSIRSEKLAALLLRRILAHVWGAEVIYYSCTCVGSLLSGPEGPLLQLFFEVTKVPCSLRRCRPQL
jgi:hypothetical protein